jgi:2-aminoadipate transaminase
MADNDRSERFDHLLAGTVRDQLGGSPYGAWRSVRDADAVQLSFGFPFPESFPNDELAAATAAVLEREGDRVMQYGGGEYADALSDFVADRASDRGIDLESRTVSLTNGATDGLATVCDAFLEPGDTVVVGAPTFMGALTVFRSYGVELESVPVDESGLDVAALEDRLASMRERGLTTPTMVYVVPNFQNPTGATLTRERRERLVALAEEYDFVVLEDDAYGELRYDGDPVPPLAAVGERGRVVRVGTFSKTISPGVRTGWVIADEELEEPLKIASAGGTNTFTQSVVARYAEDGRYDANVRDLREAYGERRDEALASLSRHMPADADWTDPDGGFFVWITLPEGIDAERLLETAAEEGVVYLPGSMFYPDDGGENCLRVSFSYVDSEAFDRGVEALGRAVRGAMTDQ